MIYLSGSTTVATQDRLIALGCGLMLNPRSRYQPARLPDFPAFACDNGCFSQGQGFNADRWLSWLKKHQPHRERCLFAVAPDVVGDAQATISRSQPYLAQIRDMGFPAAFVGQDGQEQLPVPWDDFDCLFIGGSTSWKLSEPAFALVAQAKARGKWTHMGRVNSYIRFRAAYAGGYDSCDGTYLAYGPDVNVDRLGRWLRGRQQLPLWGNV